jgi:serine/threonine protein kinase/tetratricopeptide (TPR) repeat protein
LDNATLPRAGQTISHYELLEQAGTGGMGVVYKARDRRLDRLVALKFLAPELQAATEQVDNFLHEARAISRLNHPNIATIYDVGAEGPHRFLAFEYLPGGSLRALIREIHGKGGKLELRSILSYARQIADALNHAHRHGIIHRDVKSENVLLTGSGVVKLTDFGVALVAGRDSGGSPDTAGTAAYMSPEQAQGLEVDARSDLFSFGVVLFELVTGTVPFSDRQEAVVLYDIVHTQEPPLSRFRADLPDRLQAVVHRTLQKEPSERYQSMEALLAELSAVPSDGGGPISRRGPRPRPEPTIAVLPFVDMSPAKDQDYFCDGVTEEIINALTGVKGLKVVSRTSTFKFKDQAYDIREIGQQLGVQTVLEGSVRKAGERLRITVQHINVSDGYHLWSRRYDRDMKDVFAIQDEIARSVVEQLRQDLAGEAAQGLSRRRTGNLDAYQCYLQGRYHLNERVETALKKSLACFQNAVDQDPHYALAFAGLAEAQILLAAGDYADEPVPQTLSKAREAAKRAIELDEDCAEAHAALGLVHFRADWDFARSESEFLRALEINEGYAGGHHQYAMLLALIQRLDEAIRQIRRAHELDPLSPIISTAVGRILHFASRYDEAIEQLERTVKQNPQFANVYFDLSISYALKERFEESLAAMRKVTELTGDPVREFIVGIHVETRLGNTVSAMEYFEKFRQADQAHRRPAMAWAIAEAGLGRYDRAMEQLRRSYEERDLSLLYLQCESFWEPLRSRDDYHELVRRIGFPNV